MPLEFFYMDNVFYFFGGASLFYLGTYGYGADVTTADERAFRQDRVAVARLREPRAALVARGGEIRGPNKDAACLTSKE